MKLELKLVVFIYFVEVYFSMVASGRAAEAAQ